MAKYPKFLKQAYVFTPGNPRVGLNGENATIGAAGDFLIDFGQMEQQDIKDHLDTFRENLTATFSALWDETPRVLFDFEMEDT